MRTRWFSPRERAGTRPSLNLSPPLSPLAAGFLVLWASGDWLLLADELAGTEQPFVQHLMELRDRLIYSLIGLGGFKGAPDHGQVEIGYEIAPGYRLRGLATEAADASRTGLRILAYRARAIGAPVCDS